ESLGDAQRPARTAADVEVATAASPRRAVPPEATRQHAPAPSREQAGTPVPQRGVAEAGGERPAGGPDARGRALERYARGRLVVARVVIGVAVSQAVVADARALVEEAAPPTARHRIDAGQREGAIGSGPERIGVDGATEKAGGVDGGDRHLPSSRGASGRGPGGAAPSARTYPPRRRRRPRSARRAG